MLTLPPVLAPMAVLALLVAPSPGGDLAAEDRRYVGLSYLPVMAGVVTGLQVYELDSALLCDRLRAGVGVGGACFVPPGWARYARLAASELAAVGPVAGVHIVDGGVTLQVWLLDEAGDVMDVQVTCSGGRIDVLPGTAELAVVVLPGGGSCGNGLALGGTLHVYY